MKFLKSCFKLIISAVIIIAIVVIAKEYFQPKQSFNQSGFETTAKLSGETLKCSLNDMGFLITTEYNYTHAETYEKSRPFFKIKEFPGTKAKFVYSCDGVISAGVNFEKINLITDETENKITITVDMPEAEIHSSELDLDSFKMLDEERNIFNPITVEEVKNSFNNIKSYEEQKAKEKGLLVKANANAKTLIENFLKSSIGDKEYEIKFEKIK